MQLKRLYDIPLHYAFMTSINHACVKVKLCTKLLIYSVLAKKGKSNDDITDNKDNNNNNKCDTVSIKTVKKKRENVFQLLQFDTRVDLSVYTDWMPVMSKINI